MMGSGKSTVGLALATALGWEFVDLDLEIEREAGLPVDQIFAAKGEAEFRRLEAQLTPRFLSRTNLVLAPGGGWVTNPGLLDGLPSDTLTVWLQVSAAEIHRRLSRGGARPIRPLLAGSDARDRIQALLTQREPLYRRAEIIVETGGRTIDQIVDHLSDVVRSAGMEADEGTT